MEDGNVTFNERGEIRCKINAFFEELKTGNRMFRSPKFLLNGQNCYILYCFMKPAFISLQIRNASELQNKCFNIRINKTTGEIYINRITAMTNQKRYYITCREIERENVLDSENILTEDGSLSLFIIHEQSNEEKDATASSRESASNVKDAMTQTICSDASDSVADNFKKLLASGRHADVKIKVGEKEFQVHKCILSAQSSVLDSMFAYDMQENKSGVLNITDCNENTLQDLQTFLYTGRLDDDISSSRTVQLYVIADKYDLPQLKKEYVRHFIIEMSVDSVCDVLRVAVFYEEKELMENGKDFFIENAEDVVGSTKWKKFMKDYLEIGNELILKSLKFSKLNVKN